MRQMKLTTVNYREEFVVQSFGINIIFHYCAFILIYISVQYLLGGLNIRDNALIDSIQWPFIVFMLVISLLGWLDDFWGAKHIKGFKGHFQMLLKYHEVTTGLLKAAFGFAASAFICYYYSRDVIEWFVYTFVLVLSIHLFNLLDLRPGRAIKSSFIFFLAGIPSATPNEYLIIFGPFMLSLIVLFHYDRHRLAMLGDSGALLVGGIVGWIMISQLTLLVNVCLLVIFIMLSLYAERYSFTVYIKNTPWLSKIDNWGIR